MAASENAVIKKAQLLLASIGLLFSTIAGNAQQAQEFNVKSRQIENFQIGSNEQRFGQLEFVGGLELIGESPDFGACSGIALAKDQSTYVGVADTGFWITGKIARDVENKPIGISAQMREIIGKEGTPITAKWQADAEGIALRDDKAIVSFERAHRISIYEMSGPSGPKLESEFAPPVPIHELRQNRGFEGIAIAPEGTKLSGALVGVSEKSLDKNKNIMAFVRPGKGASFEFSVKRIDEYDVTDMAFLPSGDMVLLERRFNVTDGIGMRLRRIDANAISSGATVDGPVLLEADMRYQIDNIEGMDITVDSDGTPRLTLVSDDNHSLLQRNLLLEFKYREN